MSRNRRSARSTLAIVLAAALVTTPAVVVPSLGAANIGPMAGVFADANPRASISKTKWHSDRHVSIWIKSPAMECGRQVQLLLPPNFKQRKNERFPVLYMLDGMRAATNYTGWIKYTNIIKKTAKSQMIIALPIGGASSFYTNWQKSPEKKNAMQWETFLTKELPDLLRRSWRANDVAGIAGLSMGGTAAVTLAERNPKLYRFVGSYSGYLDTTSDGMPEAIDKAMKEVKPNYSAEMMWGPYNNKNWKAHDPKLNTKALRGKSIYISSGTGNTGKYDKPSAISSIPEDHTAYMLELMANITSKTFAAEAKKQGVKMTTNFRETGTHSWRYWQDDFNDSLPQIQRALYGGKNSQNTRSATEKKAAPAPKPANCKPHGDIGAHLKNNPDVAKQLGPCTSDEYDVPEGRAQNFENGRLVWNSKTRAVRLEEKK